MMKKQMGITMNISQMNKACMHESQSVHMAQSPVVQQPLH